MTYRDPQEIPTVRKEKDALERFRKRVVDAELLKAEELDAIDSEIGAKMKQAVKDAKAAAYPTEADLLTDVYIRY